MSLYERADRHYTDDEIRSIANSLENTGSSQYGKDEVVYTSYGRAVKQVIAERDQLKADVQSLERFRDLRTRHNDEMQLRTSQLAKSEAERDQAIATIGPTERELVRVREALSEFKFLAETGGVCTSCPYWVESVGDCGACEVCRRQKRFDEAEALAAKAPEQEQEALSRA